MAWRQRNGPAAPARISATPTSREWIGGTFALISAIAFALNVACGPLVFEDGGNIHAINYLRPVAFLACIAAWLALTRASLRLPVRQHLGCLALGAILCIEFYAVFSAVQYIPVGLAILIMYTYPIIVALLDGFIGRRKLRAGLFVALAVTFCGLALALGAPQVSPDWRGIALACLAASGMCALVMVSQRTTEGYDSKVVMFYTMLAASAVMMALYLVGPAVAWPRSAVGIAALAVTTSAYIVATFFLFVSITMIGPVRFAAIDNTSPVWATLFGLLLLGETLEPLQWLGIMLVVSGVVAVQFLHAPVQQASQVPKAK